MFTIYIYFFAKYFGLISEIFTNQRRVMFIDLLYVLKVAYYSFQKRKKTFLKL